MRSTHILHTRGILQTYAAFLILLLLFSSCGGGGSGGGRKDAGNDNPGVGSSPPTVETVSPTSGPVTGGEHVIIKGTDFAPEEFTRVVFGSEFASGVNVIDPETIVCVTPPHAEGIVNVTVVNKFGSDTLPGAFSFTEVPSILWLDCQKERNRLDFSWELSEPGDAIFFFRGNRLEKAMAGDVEGYVYEEACLGYFRYTVALYRKGQRIDQRDVLIDLGRVVWEAPTNSPYTGFYLYVAEAINNDPYSLLPYMEPSEYDLDCGKATEVSFRTLYKNTLISGRCKYFVAVSSYYGTPPGNMISNLSPPLSFYCFVELAMP